jgi:pimeloyl-ACP methyl ester carboxylesterase
MQRGLLKLWRALGVVVLLALAGLIVVPTLAAAQSIPSRGGSSPHRGPKPTIVPAQGESLKQLTFAKPGSCLTGGGDLRNVFDFAVDPSQPKGDYDLYLKIAPGTDYAGFAACFANDVSPREAAILGAVQRPFALGAFTAASRAPAWATIPSWAVIGTQDRAIPPAELTFMAQRAHSKITYVTAGHLSMITQPSAVAKVIERAASSTR